MNNIYKALNVRDSNSLEKLIESLELNTEQYIAFYTALTEDLTVDGVRYVVESLTKEFDNGSYEKIQKQICKEDYNTENDLRANPANANDNDNDNNWIEEYGKKFIELQRKAANENKGDIFIQNFGKAMEKYTKGQLTFSDLTSYELAADAFGKENSEQVYQSILNELNKETFNESEIVGWVVIPWGGDAYRVYKKSADGKVIEDERSRIVDTAEEAFELAKELNQQDMQANVTLNPQNPNLTSNPQNTGKNLFNESADVESDLEDESVEAEEPKEKSSADPKLKSEIETIKDMVDTAANPTILKNLLATIDSKIQLAVDVEQINDLGELKQKVETKIGTLINESVNDEDYEEIFDIGDKVSFTIKDRELTGRITGKTMRNVPYYEIVCFDNGALHTYINMDPINNNIKRIEGDE